MKYRIKLAIVNDSQHDPVERSWYSAEVPLEVANRLFDNHVGALSNMVTLARSLMGKEL